MRGFASCNHNHGKSFEHKDIYEWRTINQRLKDSRHLENQEVYGDIYSSLKISYDYLKGNNSRTCLKLCSLFPEDHEISVEELTAYGIGLGMFPDVNSIEVARGEMRVTVTNLQKSNLLLETNDVIYVKMHDVVRDFVHWKTSEGENMFFVKSGLKDWPSQSLGCYTAISLINSEINHFPDGLEFPKLEAFLLDGSGSIFKFYEVPSMFFQGMKALKVLVLRHISLSLEVLQFLPNLRTLQLEHCELRNASSLGSLEKLEILVVAGRKVKVLFDDLTGLTTSLKLLTIHSPYSAAFSLPENLLSSLVQLEKLYLGVPIKWAFTEKSADGASLSELLLLPRLIDLSLEVFSECIPENFVFPPLQRYDIAVNENRLFPYRCHNSSRCLTITKFSLTAFEELFCDVEELALRQITDLECLIDTTKKQGPKSAFNNLVRLTLENMICLKGLCHGLPLVGFLQKLEFLTIGNCPDVVFEVATIKNLKELTVIGCQQLQVWKGPSHNVISLQSLMKVTISCCNKLKSIFLLSLAQTLVHLEYLKISKCNKLEQVFDCAEGRHGTEIKHVDHELQSLGLPNLLRLHLDSLPELWSLSTGSSHYVISLRSLTEVTISCCNKLKSVFSLSLTQTLVHLEHLEISMCNRLEQIFDSAEGRDRTKIMHLGLPNLIRLHLDSLPELRNLWIGPSHHVTSLQSLREVTINCCNKLNFAFPFSLARSLALHLQELYVSNCEGLEQVFYCVKETDHVEDIKLPQLHTLVLARLISLRNFYTENNFVKLPSLKKLEVRKCGQNVGLEVTTTQFDLEDVDVQVSNKVKEKADERHKLFLPLLKKFVVAKCPQLAPFVIQEEVNNQAQVTGLYLSNWQFNSFDILLRQSSPNLEHFAIGNHLQFLQWLIVSNCNKLKSLFSPMLAQSLLHLNHLYIEHCEELEQIIDKDKTSASSSHGHRQPIFFPRLIEICVQGCSNLKSLFFVSVSLSLSQLQLFRIRGASKLKQVFKYQGGTDVIEDTKKEIALPLLRELSLEELPRLKSFTPMGYHCSFPHLCSLNVEKCPNLTTSFSIDSKHIMQARTKAVADVPMESSFTDVDLMKVSDKDGETTWPVGSDINWKLEEDPAACCIS